MSDLDTTGMSVVEKRKAQKAELRPLANRRPELYDEDEYSSAEYEQMMEMYNGTLASIDDVASMAGWFGGTALYYPPPALADRLVAAGTHFVIKPYILPFLQELKKATAGQA